MGSWLLPGKTPSMIPLGMAFGELMGMAASTQTPGIIGHARSYLSIG